MNEGVVERQGAGGLLEKTRGACVLFQNRELGVDNRTSMTPHAAHSKFILMVVAVTLIVI